MIAPQHLTYPSSNLAPADTRWFYIRETGPDFRVKQLENHIQLCEQMAVRCRAGDGSGFNKLRPELADGYETAAKETRAELAALRAQQSKTGESA